MLFYMRFFLHSIPADVQAGLMSTISDVARSGDVLAAEFRTDKDEALQFLSYFDPLTGLAKRVVSGEADFGAACWRTSFFRRERWQMDSFSQ